MYDPTIDWKLAFMIEHLQIAAGGYHSLLLDIKGNVFGTGDNEYGQLGNGSNTNAKTPVEIDTSNIENQIVQIAAGSFHSLLLDNQGNAFGTGMNNDGQLGNGSTNDAKIPIKMDTSNIKNPIVQISTGSSHSLLLDNQGNAFGTGRNLSGQLGNGSNTNAKIPVEIDTSNIKNPIVQISAGYYYSLLLDDQGNVFGTGMNNNGQLGNGSTNDAKIPIRMDTSNIKNPIVQISTGGSHSLLLDNKGNVFGTGSNRSGQLGNGSNTNASIPIKMDTSNIKNPIVQIATGPAYTILLDNQGNVFGTGINTIGQLGNGSINEAKIPVEMNTSNIKNPIIQIAAGTYHSLLLDNRGNVFGTGLNSHGQLGLLNFSKCTIPTFITNLLKL